MSEGREQAQEWHRHYYGGKLGLAILMHDELDLVAETIGRMRRRVARLILARTGTDLPEEWPQHLDAHELLPALPPDLSRWEIPAQAITRGYACLARMAAGFEEVDWWVFLTGDTVLLHEYGLERLAASAEQVQADVSVCQAIGQDFHRADLTLADLEAGSGGGRKQSADLADFMPQLFLVKGSRIREGWLHDIPVTNRWCSEQCLGDCLPAGYRRHVYATVAHQFQDGVVPQAKGAPGAA